MSECQDVLGADLQNVTNGGEGERGWEVRVREIEKGKSEREGGGESVGGESQRER